MNEKPYNALETAFGSGEGGEYIATPSSDQVPAESPRVPDSTDSAKPAPAPAPELKQENKPTPEELADHARLKEIGFFALNDIAKAFEATKSLGRIIDDYGSDGEEEEADQRPLLDGLYLTVDDGVVVGHHDAVALERQIEAAEAGIRTAQDGIKNLGFLQSMFGSKKTELENEVSRFTRNKNSASSKLRRVQELVGEVERFCKQIPKPFLSEVSSGDISLSDFVERVQPKLDEALALKKKYPNYKEILGTVK